MSINQETLFEISESLSKRVSEDGLAALSVPEQNFLLVWTVDSEVHSGGFDSFFFYAPGNIASETVDALEVIGAAHTANLMRQANAVFGLAGPSTDIDERQVQFRELSAESKSELDALDHRFWEYQEDLGDLLHEYVLKHPQVF